MAAKKKRTKRQKVTAERKYEVRTEIANFTLAKAKSALTLQIYRRNEKFGTLEIGRGSLRWWPANRPTEHRVGWARFAKMMDERAYRSR